MDKMDEKKVAAKVLASKSVQEFIKYAGTVLTAVVAPNALVDKIARVVSDPEFIKAENQIDWLISKAEAVIIEHISQNCKDPMTKVQIGFDLAALAEMSVGDLLPTLQEVANE